jgi:hypothetical protein
VLPIYKNVSLKHQIVTMRVNSFKDTMQFPVQK